MGDPKPEDHAQQRCIDFAISYDILTPLLYFDNSRGARLGVSFVHLSVTGKGHFRKKCCSFMKHILLKIVCFRYFDEKKYLVECKVRCSMMYSTLLSISSNDVLSTKSAHFIFYFDIDMNCEND